MYVVQAVTADRLDYYWATYCLPSVVILTSVAPHDAWVTSYSKPRRSGRADWGGRSRNVSPVVWLPGWPLPSARRYC